MKTLEEIFIFYCIVFLLWMSFRWTTKTFTDSMMKVSLFLIAVIGIIIALKRHTII